MSEPIHDDKPHAYTPDQQRVADYIVERSGDNIGGGDDPIGFLMASHAYLGSKLEQLTSARSAVAAIPVADVRKLLCERCRAGYPFYGDKFEQHIVPSYSGDTYLDCRATEKLHGLPSAPQSAKLRSDDWHDELLLRWCEWTGGHLSDQNFLGIIHDIVNDNLLPGSMRAPDSRTVPE